MAPDHQLTDIDAIHLLRTEIAIFDARTPTLGHKFFQVFDKFFTVFSWFCFITGISAVSYFFGTA